MRFLEKHWRTVLDGKSSPVARAVVPIDINDPARWYFEEAEVYETSVRDQFPTVVAPYPVTFLEYRIPPKWKVKVGEEWKLMKAPHGPSDFFGMLIIQEELKDNYTGADPAEGKVLNELMRNVPGATAPKWKQFTFLFAGNQQDRQVCCWAENYVQRNGQMLGGPVRDVASTLKNAARMVTDADAYGNILRSYGYPAYFALSLMASPDSKVYNENLSNEDYAKREKAHGIAFNYSVAQHPRTGTIADTLESVRKAWTFQDKDAYVTYLPGHKSAMEELKTYKFKI
jgi:hypothetical protein